MNLKQFKNVHFIGVGGISMSGLAEALAGRGCAVSGSDSRRSDLTDNLQKKGVFITFGQRAENVRPDTELVVYSAAIKEDNPELLAAKEMGVPVVDRARLMGILMDEYEFAVCVAGTHGKTSTTSMLAEIFLLAGLDPSINLGGILPSIGGNYRVGGGRLFLAEACEYYDSFLQFFPYVGVILNMEADHLDYFRDLEHIRQSFYKFAQNIRPEGALIINSRCQDMLSGGLRCRSLTFGVLDADFTARDITLDPNGCAKFRMFHRAECLFNLHLRVCGMHNAMNSLAAAAAALYIGVPAQEVKDALEGYLGVNRRFEYKGELNGVTIVDDYAHHPTEVAATLAAACNGRWRRVFVVFQPHTYTRTKLLKNELAAAFDNVYHLSLLDIYAAREKDLGDIHSRDLLKLIRNRGIRADYFDSFTNVEKFLLNHCIQGDLLITMGAGDVYLVGEMMLHTGLSKLSTENHV